MLADLGPHSQLPAGYMRLTADDTSGARYLIREVDHVEAAVPALWETELVR